MGWAMRGFAKWRRSLWVVLAAGCVAIGAAWGQAGGGGGSVARAAGQNSGQLPADVREAISLEKQGKADEAAAAWRRVVKADPKNAQAFAQLGLLEARLGHYDEAIAAYRAARKLKPGMPGLELNYGLALFKSERFQEAVVVIEGELKQHPEGPEGVRLTMLAGMAHYGAREYKAAAGYLKRAAESDPRNPTLLLALGHCYLWTGQVDEALVVDRRILEINPDSAEADMIAGEALDAKGDSSGAVAQFQAAVRANPKEPQAHFGLAYLLWTQKRYDEAVPEFEAELQNDPRNSLAMIYMADAYVRQSKYELARPVLEKAVRDKPEVPLVHLNLGIVLMETGKKEGAIAELNKAIALEPDNVAAHFRLAQLYRDMGRKDEAKAEFARASALNRKTDESLFQRIAEAGTKGKPSDTLGKSEKKEEVAPSAGQTAEHPQ